MRIAECGLRDNGRFALFNLLFLLTHYNKQGICPAFVFFSANQKAALGSTFSSIAARGNHNKNESNNKNLYLR